MDFPNDMFSGPWLAFSFGIFAVLLLGALVTAPWHKVRGDNEALHVYLATCVFTLMLWAIKAGITPGLNFHLLGVTTLTLMFGWQFAFLAVCLVLVGITLNGGAGWEAFAFNALVMGAVPIAVTQILLYLAQTRLPHNFFIYIFINAFLGAGLAGVVMGSVAASLMVAGDVHSLSRISYEFLPFFPLLFFSEALFNGMMMTLLVGLRPQWVASFDDETYIKGK
ncbi:MAG: energy-coupling factor ABC transporter permease [Chromatiales bacterium]|nr:energy-coupling factor ABC transporter permease [Chromatiales bacterium]